MPRNWDVMVKERRSIPQSMPEGRSSSSTTSDEVSELDIGFEQCSRAIASISPNAPTAVRGIWRCRHVGDQVTTLKQSLLEATLRMAMNGDSSIFTMTDYFVYWKS